MTFKTPEFWYRSESSPPPFIEKALIPLAGLYSFFFDLHQGSHTAKIVDLPVLCIGNIVAGGTGKTPTAIALLETIKDKNLAQNPFFLIRGYGGAAVGPVLVDPNVHTAWDVGDEALILAKYAPTIVGADRVLSAELAKEEGADALVLDDGLQNPGIHKDLKLVVINGEMGLGNKRTMPAGPMRQPIEKGTDIADAFILIGDDKRDVVSTLPDDKPVIRAHIAPAPCFKPDKSKKYIAFAGLGYPQKYFNFLEDYGLNLIEKIAFSDHHPYEVKDIEALAQKAKDTGAQLITTRKDMMRIPNAEAFDIATAPISLIWDTPEALLPLLETVLKKP